MYIQKKHNKLLFQRRLQSLLCPANLLVATVKDNKSSLESNITKDVDTNILTGLDTTEAGGRSVLDRSVVDVRTGDGNGHTTNSKAEVGQRSGAAEDVTAVRRAVASTANLGVVGRVDGGREKKEGGTGIGNTSDGASVDKSLRGVNGSVANLAGIRRAVDETKVVGSGLLVLQVGCEDSGLEAGGSVVEEGVLLGGCDGVDGAETKTEEAVETSLLLKLVRDTLGRLYSLGADNEASNRDLVLVNVSG
ncbi:hypothetical protein HG531_004810 [Fusarium graminearum]|nr:hypothetical protein HG531_004810 [Fusarium graminearum]